MVISWPLTDLENKLSKKNFVCRTLLAWGIFKIFLINCPGAIFKILHGKRQRILANHRGHHVPTTSEQFCDRSARLWDRARLCPVKFSIWTLRSFPSLIVPEGLKMSSYPARDKLRHLTSRPRGVAILVVEAKLNSGVREFWDDSEWL